MDILVISKVINVEGSVEGANAERRPSQGEQRMVSRASLRSRWDSCLSGRVWPQAPQIQYPQVNLLSHPPGHVMS